jgi:hypothetical protein
MSEDDDPFDMPELALISDARQLAALAEMLLEHPKFKAGEGNSGLYVTAQKNSKMIKHLVRDVGECSSAEEFDVLLYLICRSAEGLARALSLLRIP